MLNTFLVEDSATIRDSLVPSLAELGSAHVMAVAEGEADAVDWLKVHDGRWDLAVVDLFLKEGSGLGVLAGCRDREAHQNVVVLTNYATAEIRRRCFGLGADAVFDKSTELEELFAYCAALGASKPGGG